MRKSSYWVFLCFTLLFAACESDGPKQKVKKESKKSFRIVVENVDALDKKNHIGDSLQIGIEWLSEESFGKPIIFRINDAELGLINTADERIGARIPNRTGRIQIMGSNGMNTKYLTLNVLSDIEAKKLDWELINIFPHDEEAYTQGLFYENGKLYEGTGLKKRSSLRHVELKTGNLIQSVNLPSEIFGEGITVIGDEIYQLSWRAGRGFVFNKNDLQLIREFNYSGEGWGLTHDDQFIYRSDGTQIIHIMDKYSLQIIDQIEVHNDRGPITQLNELEFINGYIYANIYGNTEIAVIEPSSGRVVAYLNLEALEKRIERDKYRDVMNGIAYNPENGHIYITGKLWPSLFELKIEDVH